MSPLLTQSTAPADLFTLAEAKDQLAVLDSDRDGLIELLISAVSRHFDGPDGIICRALAPQAYTYAHTPSDRLEGGALPLPIGPAIAITAFTYYDRDNAQQSATIGDFDVYSSQRGGAWIQPAQDKSWPEAYNRPDALTITYSAGEATLADVPADLIAAAKLMLTDLFELRSTRERNAYKKSATFEDLIAGYRTWAA